MEEIRESVKQYLKALGWSQNKLCREINMAQDYRVNPGEMSLALGGSLETPKAKKMLIDSMALLRTRVKKEAMEVC